MRVYSLRCWVYHHQVWSYWLFWDGIKLYLLSLWYSYLTGTSSEVFTLITLICSWSSTSILTFQVAGRNRLLCRIIMLSWLWCSICNQIPIFKNSTIPRSTWRKKSQSHSQSQVLVNWKFKISKWKKYFNTGIKVHIAWSSFLFNVSLQI